MAEAPAGPGRAERHVWKGAGFILGAVLSWGWVSTLVKLLFNRGDVTPLSLTVLRVSISFLFLLAVLGPRRGRELLVRRQDLPLLVIMAWFGFAVNAYCYYKALSLTNVATAVLLSYLAPVFLALHSGLVLRRWPSPPTLLAIGLAISGCFILVKGYDPGALRLNLAGLGYGLANAAGFAAFGITSQRITHRYGIWVTLLYGFGIATLTWWIIVPPWTILAAGYPAWLWAAFLAIALGGTLLPFGLFVRGLADLSPTHATILSTMEPVVAGTIAYLVLGERMAGAQYGGAVLVLAAILLVQLWPAPPAEAPSP